MRRVEVALAEGQFWRAKEILQGLLANGGHDPALYERYGRVLLQMGDLREAGRYLFLSGRREPEYQQAIDLFLGRHARRGWRSLLSAFPKPARRIRPDAYPDSVRRELVKLGMPAAGDRATANRLLVDVSAHGNGPAPRFRDRLLGVGCMASIFFAGFCMLVGFTDVLVTLIRWLR